MTAIATSAGSAQRGSAVGRRVPTFSHRPSSSWAEITRSGGSRGWRQRRSRGHCRRRPGPAPGVARPGAGVGIAAPAGSAPVRLARAPPVAPAAVLVAPVDQHLARPDAVEHGRPGAGAASCRGSPHRRRRRRSLGSARSAAGGVLAVRTICSCSAGGVLSIRRTIEAVRERMCLRSAELQRAASARRAKIRKLDRLGQDQREQQQRDQLAGEPARPQAPQPRPDPRACASCALDLGGQHVAAAPHGLDQRRLLRVGLDLRRSRLTWLSMLRSNTAAARPRVRSSSWSRLSTIRGWREQRAQQQELGGAERDRDAVLADQLALRDVERPAVEAQPARRRSPACAAAAGCWRGAAPP